MKYLLTTLLLGYAVLVAGQNKLIGTIINQNQEPVEALLTIDELHQQAKSDKKGSFSFVNLPHGNFVITIISNGYETKNIQILIEKNTQPLLIELTTAVIHMDEVIVSSAFQKMQSQNVMKVSHLKMKALQESGAATLIEALSNIPGVAQISTGTSIGKPVIRGLSGNRVLVYAQGVRIENQQFGEEHGLGMNDSGIESVEVIKGPASLLYGSDALGGVLYFNPEKFAPINTLKSDFQQKLFYNTLGSVSNLGAKYSTENWKFLVRGNYATHSDYQTPYQDRVLNSRFNESDFKSAIGYNNASFSTTFRYNFNQLGIGIPEEGFGSTFVSKSLLYPKQEVSNQVLSSNSIVYFKNSKLTSDIGFIDNIRKELEPSPGEVLDMQLKTVNYTVKYFFPKWKSVETVIGSQGMHQTNKNNGTRFLIPDAKTQDLGFFGTSNLDWKSHTFQIGLRFDSRSIQTNAMGIIGEMGYFEALNKNFNSTNFALGYKTNWLQKGILRFNVASGFRAPNLAELTSNGIHEGSNRYEKGNANLKNEQNLQLDLNIEYQNSHFECFGNVFWNHINNFITLSPTNEVIELEMVYSYNPTNANLYGGEFGIHFHPHPLDWLHLTSSFESVTGVNDNGDYLSFIPANKFNSNMKIDFNWNKKNNKATMNLSMENYLAQNKVSLNETKSPGFTLLNFGFSSNFSYLSHKINVQFNINNLLNETYISHLSRFKTDGIPNIGRNILLGVQFEI